MASHVAEKKQNRRSEERRFASESLAGSAAVARSRYGDRRAAVGRSDGRRVRGLDDVACAVGERDAAAYRNGEERQQT
jgi:hypothetical protein